MSLTKIAKYIERSILRITKLSAVRAINGVCYDYALQLREAPDGSGAEFNLISRRARRNSTQDESAGQAYSIISDVRDATRGFRSRAAILTTSGGSRDAS